MTKRAPIGIIATVLLAGLTMACSGDGGGAPDASVPPIDAPSAPDAQTSAVNGTCITTHHMAAGTMDVPCNLQGLTIAALVPDGAGGFQTFPGSGTSAGTFTIPAVPVGTYYLRAGNDQVIVTSAHDVDLGQDVVGRPNPQRVLAATDVSFSVTNLDAWEQYDRLHFYSPETGANDWYLEFTGPAQPMIGATTFSATTDYSDFDVPYLIDETLGDTAQLTHLTLRASASGAQYQAAGRVFRPAPFTIASGLTLSGAFEDLAQTGSISSLTWMRGAFHGYDALFHPAGVPTYDWLVVIPAPYGVIDFNIPPVLELFYNPGSANTQLTDLAFGNPSPSEWPLVVRSQHRFDVPVQATGGDVSTWYGSIADRRLLADVIGGDMTPSLSPVQGLQIGGANAQQALTGVTTTPTISWSAPSLGTPGKYVVIMWMVYAVGGVTYSEYVGELHTQDTQVTVPPGMLEASRQYLLAVHARVEDGIDFSWQPYRRALTGAHAWAYSSLFTP